MFEQVASKTMFVELDNSTDTENDAIVFLWLTKSMQEVNDVELYHCLLAHTQDCAGDEDWTSCSSALLPCLSGV